MNIKKFMEAHYIITILIMTSELICPDLIGCTTAVPIDSPILSLDINVYSHIQSRKPYIANNFLLVIHERSSTLSDNIS